jgi:hypothetical protein
MMDKAPEELSGVVSTALSYLSLYRDPLVAAATSSSDFRILDLVEGERPVTLYIAVPPSDLTRTRPLLRLFLNQLCRNLIQSLDPDRREVLFLLDEFPALRRLLFFVDSLAYLAGYRVRSLIVIQDMAQLQANLRDARVDHRQLPGAHRAHPQPAGDRADPLQHAGHLHRPPRPHHAALRRPALRVEHHAGRGQAPSAHPGRGATAPRRRRSRLPLRPATGPRHARPL